MGWVELLWRVLFHHGPAIPAPSTTTRRLAVPAAGGLLELRLDRFFGNLGDPAARELVALMLTIGSFWNG